jgi:xylulokinase
MSLLAVDIGSSACKAVAFAAGGEILAQHSSGFTPEFPQPGFAEMPANKFWDALCISCGAVAHGLTDPVQALCLSSHGETFVAVDSHGNPLRNAILNQDSRALRESARCEEIIGRERLFHISGHQTHPMYPIPKILWLREHEPKLFTSTAAFLTLIGFLLQKMGLPPYVDYSLASRFLAFDITRRAWSDEILSAVDLQKSRLPKPVPAGTIAGKLDLAAASQLGLPAGIPVVLGGHDQPCNALGSGVTSGSRVSDSMGTYECLLAASDAPSLNDTALRASLNSYCHVVPGKFVTLAYFPSGIMVKWFHDLLYANGSGAPSGADSHDHEGSHYDFLEAHSPAGPTGLCITPHLIGTCNPEFNPRARAFIGGLNPGTDRAHIYKGILEGLACELQVVSEGLAEAVGGFDDIYATGGGARSTLGLQLRAALTGRRVHVMKQQEAVCLGTAILAWVAIGEYSSIDQAVAALVGEDRVVAPDSTIAGSYQTLRAQYRQLRSVAVEA